MATQTGYKASKLGMIPQDWEIRRIGDFAPLQRGFDLPNSEIQSGDYPVVYSNGIGNYHNRYTVKSPCIATGRSGTLGKVHYVEQDCWVHNTSLWVTKFDNCEPKFIYFLFQKIGFERFASGSGVPTLNRNDAHEFKIALPKSTTEQTAIAAALSDTDALIGSLKTLIAKKQALKLSAIQNLLGGKIRLPGFALRPDGSLKTTRQTELGCVPEDWEVVELGDVCDILSGINLSQNSKGSYPVTRIETIANGNIDLNRIGYVETSQDIENYKLNYGDILFSNINSLDHIGKTAFYSACYELYHGTNLLRLVAKNINAKFLFENLNSKPQRIFFQKIANQAVSQASINRTQLSKTLILKPKSISEQTAIAQLLSDMDAEIESLECRLKKTQSLKQGMMQALLTGKIRLPLE